MLSLIKRDDMIRKAIINDASRIAEIHTFGWRSAYRGIVSDIYLFTKMSVENGIHKFQEAIENQIEETYIYEESNIVKGFMTIGKCRNYDKKNSFELWGLYIEPLMKNNGIGSLMIKYCEEIALERGFDENVLWTLKQNILGRKFYEKHGYITDGKEELLEHINSVEIRYVKSLK
jgi:N-acetylglutamate synthase-like GNAT family acetyltransferase